MLDESEDYVSTTLKFDITNAETESPGMFIKADNANFATRVTKPSSVVTVTLFIIVGLLAIIFTMILRGNKKKEKMTQCIVGVQSYYINYGTTNIQLPQFMTQSNDVQERRYYNNFIIKLSKDRYNNNSKYYLTNERHCLLGARKKPITMVSDKWKAKSQQSNNFFIINIIPEEDENQDGNV